ncbi:ABC transporter permease [Streptomyces sp. NBC_00385]|uniref:ABC transporter permease n=1 Tax=Streptomyces sp. NBC_00385 TaxID=2975733 RepID=UPI002DD81C80|nr:ABC transporter permease [Streptomyces sp. NBC_00385]WRZ07151.1 ABC transporter permease [Streptomyces sp. NBC_00385]
MTAPLTPPHQPSPHDPWQKPPEGAGSGGSHLGTPLRSPEEGELRTELRRAALVAVAVTVAGLALGLLWLWLAPRVPLVSDDTAVFLSDSEGEEAIGADGTFALLALAFGAVSAGLAFWFHRKGGIALVVALAVGGVLGSLVAWQLGTRLGPTDDVVAHAREVGKGVIFDAPLELHAKGALLAWSLAAMAVHLGLTAVFGPRDPEPEWGVYHAGPVGGGPYGPAPSGAGPSPSGSAPSGPAPAPSPSPEEGPPQPGPSA